MSSNLLRALRAAAVVLSTAALHLGAGAEAFVPNALSAEQIALRNVEARGGIAAWRRVDALGLAGTMQIPPPALGPRRSIVAQAEQADGKKHETVAAPQTLHVPFLMAMRRPHQMRLEIKFKDQVAAQVFDGKRGWLVHGTPGNWSSQPLAPDQAKAISEQEDLDGPLIDYASKGTRIELEAVEPVEGRPAYRLRLRTASGVERRLWIDCQSFLDVQIDGVRQINGKLRPVSITFRDYQPADGGVMIARTIETRAQGADDSETIRIDTVAVNPVLDEASFRQPR
jgi:hypothetical protein